MPTLTLKSRVDITRLLNYLSPYGNRILRLMSSKMMRTSLAPPTWIRHWILKSVCQCRTRSTRIQDYVSWGACPKSHQCGWVDNQYFVSLHLNRHEKVSGLHISAWKSMWEKRLWHPHILDPLLDVQLGNCIHIWIYVAALYTVSVAPCLFKPIETEPSR